MVRNSRLTHAVFDSQGNAFVTGTSRQDCLVQLIGVDTPDALLESVWSQGWATKGYSLRPIQTIRPGAKGLSGYDKSPDYGSQGGENTAQMSFVTIGIIIGLGLGILAALIGKSL